MKSICIKTNNRHSIEYLLEELNNFDLENIYFSCKKFKFYRNIIVHFTGENEELFLYELSKILACLVLDLYEENIINKIVSSEYFYFDNSERNQITQNTFNDLFDEEEATYPRNQCFSLLCNDFFEYLYILYRSISHQW